MANPKELTRADIVRTAAQFRWTRKMPKWRVVVDSRELPARPLLLQAAGVPPNDPTNSHQAIAIFESLGFETRYVKENTTPSTRTAETTETAESVIELISRVSRQVPESSWSRLPTDFAKNLDHYLYGSKKVRE